MYGTNVAFYSCKYIMCRALAIAVTLVTIRFCIQMMWIYVECSCFLLIDCQKSILILQTSHLVWTHMSLFCHLYYLYYLFMDKKNLCKNFMQTCWNGCMTDRPVVCLTFVALTIRLLCKYMDIQRVNSSAYFEHVFLYELERYRFLIFVVKSTVNNRVVGQRTGLYGAVTCRRHIPA